MKSNFAGWSEIGAHYRRKLIYALLPTLCFVDELLLPVTSGLFRACDVCSPPSCD